MDPEHSSPTVIDIPSSETLRAVNLQSDNLWHLMAQSKALQEFRQEIRFSWDDSAAKDVNKRYLDPLDEENEQFIAKLKKLCQNIVTIENLYKNITEIIRKANAQSVKITELLQEVHSDVQVAYTHHDKSIEDVERSKILVQETADLISQANSCCIGIPTT